MPPPTSTRGFRKSVSRFLESFGPEVDYARDHTCRVHPMVGGRFRAKVAVTEALFMCKLFGFERIVAASGSP
jgi:hypothetical protein